MNKVVIAGIAFIAGACSVAMGYGKLEIKRTESKNAFRANVKDLVFLDTEELVDGALSVLMSGFNHVKFFHESRGASVMSHISGPLREKLVDIKGRRAEMTGDAFRAAIFEVLKEAEDKILDL